MTWTERDKDQLKLDCPKYSSLVSLDVTDGVRDGENGSLSDEYYRRVEQSLPDLFQLDGRHVRVVGINGAR
jgi:hypothetical protein